MADPAFLAATFLLLLTPSYVSCHARLMEPPSRSSMWRVGFATKRNFNDNALYCGGVQTQWSKNGGKCGICGDPWDMPQPRANEAGGVFGKGIISRKYVVGQVIKAMVDVTTNHRGHFEFRICPNNNPKKEATQECLNQHLLHIVDGAGTRYDITKKGSGKIVVLLQLPYGMTCSQCVLQWTYVAGNNWGRCSNGSTGLGCGPQETFRGCADISIGKSPEVVNGNSHFLSYPHDRKKIFPERPDHFSKPSKHYPSRKNTIYRFPSSTDIWKQRRHQSNYPPLNPEQQHMGPATPSLFKGKPFSKSSRHPSPKSKSGLRHPTFMWK